MRASDQRCDISYESREILSARVDDRDFFCLPVLVSKRAVTFFGDSDKFNYSGMKMVGVECNQK